MDVTDLVDYNAALLNHRHLPNSFFQLNRHDPTSGFSYNPSTVFGHVLPASEKGSQLASVQANADDPEDLPLRLSLGSHLARYLRHELELQKGYTSTVGISTNKLISKLVGNVNKPKGQTTLLPPYVRLHSRTLFSIPFSTRDITSSSNDMLSWCSSAFEHMPQTVAREQLIPFISI